MECLLCVSLVLGSISRQPAECSGLEPCPAASDTGRRPLKCPGKGQTFASIPQIGVQT